MSMARQGMAAMEGIHRRPSLITTIPSSSTNKGSSRYEDHSFLPISPKSQEDVTIHSRKRRRADSGASSNGSIVAADHQELAELYSNRHEIPYVTGSASGGIQLQPLNTGSTGAMASRYEPAAHGTMHRLDEMYSLAHEKMVASVPRTHSSKVYNTPSEYGPYHAQYWSLVEGDLDAGTPLASNGGYQSPYGSLTPDVYFSNVPDHSNTYGGLPQGNGYDHPGDAIYSNKSSSYGGYGAPEPANVYPSPVENFGWSYSSLDPSQHHLSVLENCSTQILNSLLASTVEEFVSAVTRPETVNGHAYANVESIFQQTTRHFLRDHSSRFIDLNLLHLSTNSALATIRKANLVIFAISIFRGRDVPFVELNEVFLDVFMPPGTQLFKEEGSLFIELKTQAYMAIMLNSGLSKEDVFDQLFPRDLQLSILRRRSEPTHLAPSEQDFIGCVNTRRQYLLAGSDDMEALAQLPQKYTWKQLLEELRTCIGRNLKYLETVKNAVAGNNTSDDPITKAALAAHAAISGQAPNSMHHYHNASVLHTPNFDSSGHKRKRSSPISPLTPESPSAPMHLQYKQARSSRSGSSTVKPHSPFTATATPPRRLPGTPSTRRPWAPEEEKALMDGLERVKGPHWSQILALYGAGGSISEILKDRNQVQLKDKARNLKLFFLKSGLDVPFFLQKVTGELKTRAPAQAAKLEARERLKRLEDHKIRRVVASGGVKKVVGLGLGVEVN